MFYYLDFNLVLKRLTRQIRKQVMYLQNHYFCTINYVCRVYHSKALISHWRDVREISPAPLVKQYGCLSPFYLQPITSIRSQQDDGRVAVVLYSTVYHEDAPVTLHTIARIICAKLHQSCIRVLFDRYRRSCVQQPFREGTPPH